eukprot:s6466_g3.t1
MVPELRKYRAYRKFTLAKMSIFTGPDGAQQVSNGIDNARLPIPVAGPNTWQPRIFWSDRSRHAYVTNGVEKKLLKELIIVPQPPEDVVTRSMQHPPLSFGTDEDLRRHELENLSSKVVRTPSKDGELDDLDGLSSRRSFSPAPSRCSESSKVFEDPPEVCIIRDEWGVFAHHVGSNESVWLHIGQDRQPSDYQVRKHSGNGQEYIRDTVDGSVSWGGDAVRTAEAPPDQMVSDGDAKPTPGAALEEFLGTGVSGGIGVAVTVPDAFPVLTGGLTEKDKRESLEAYKDFEALAAVDSLQGLDDPDDDRLDMAQTALKRQRAALNVDTNKRLSHLKELELSLNAVNQTLDSFQPNSEPEPENRSRNKEDLLSKPVLSILADNEGQQPLSCNVTSRIR